MHSIQELVKEYKPTETLDYDEAREVWYGGKKRYTSKPKGADGLYAKKGKEKFEPQDNFKGNVARAVFYFYTMYRVEAQAEDAAFFDLQRATLLQWHQQDPPDALEIERTYQIANYQSGKPNPFVIYPNLVGQFYGKK